MQNQPHRRPALKHSLCVSGVYLCEWPEGEQSDRPGGVTQLDWDRHWTFTAALGKCALEASSQCSVTHTKSHADTTTLTVAWSGSRNSRWPTFVHTYPIISPALTGLGAHKTLSRPTIQLSRRSHLYFCKCMAVDWLWLAASWGWASAFKLMFVFLSTSVSVPWTLFREWVERRFPWIRKTSLHCVPLWMCVYALKK